MLSFEYSRRKKIDEIVLIVKLIALFFCAIVFFIEYYSSKIIETEGIIKFGAFILISVCAILFLIYKIWNKSNKNCYNSTFKYVLENIFYMTLFSLLVIISNNNFSQYKFLYLFLIITTTIQLGKTYGLIIASISSAIILIIDMVKIQTSSSICNYFQTDLFLAGIFLLTAWILGYYVEAEKKYRKQLIDLGNKDELTGLYNHRYFQGAIEREIENAKKNSQFVSLLFMDIDYFKRYNDIYGHTAGDRVIKKIGQIIKSKLSNKDIGARYGGEEFAVIIHNLDEDNAIVFGEAIRKDIENTYFKGQEDLPNSNLTVSVGVSCYPDKAKNKEELINRAEDALYRAKFFNKNRVEGYHSILKELKEDIQEEHIDLISSIKTLISVINAKDKYTYGHTERVVIYTQLIAEKLNLSEDDKKILKYGAYLHDIGKIQIPMEILNKRMKLTPGEWDLIKKHPQNGVEIIKSVSSLQRVIPLILYHHERYDGKGYPQNLKENDIPYLTRILSVADSFDAMTSNRPYKESMSFNEALTELKKCSGTQFDPEIVEVFIDAIENKGNYL
ncbi:diguanylate cyclase [Maledivibacter halophilus]|uniref:Diguanylate cyclase (GGDEF) domain-containing protein/HDIG domain-containing protein n=1 Tax=Maledivibacter halophilus TaxID=36842 RepID=A0A1T5MCK6_9FIRM|nr:diguanylate cyclase [Maledivibacter halophilus]SKC85599.1 diguanylate cyclase (GGDEF) domain-containing protein/HDIG domain-containing protein [Maledivibacter halophilus]